MGVRFKNAPSDTTVLVVGAGLCGLVAAYELEKLGFNVKVFEGRTNRIGGRTKTLTNLVNGLHVDVGPEFISPAHTILRQYIHTFGLKLDEVQGMDESPFTPIIKVGGGYDNSFLDELLDVKRALIDAAHNLTPANDGENLWAFIQRLNLSERANRFLETHFEFENGESPKKISLLAYLYLIKSHGDGFFENLEKYRLHGGMASLTNSLEASLLEGTIQRGFRIKRILGSICHFDPTEPGGNFQMGGDEIICTIPPRLWENGKLFGLSIDPDIIPQMGDTLKITLKTPSECNIPTGILEGSFLDSTNLLQAIWEGGMGEVKNHRILTIMCGGSSAEKILQMKKADLITLIKTELSPYITGFSGISIKDDDCLIIDWRRKSLTGCGYGCPGPYELTEYRAELKKQLPSWLTVAGEWESPEMWGYMEGAVRSALIAARDVAERHGATIPKTLQ
jgi:monoamine oxidase